MRKYEIYIYFDLLLCLLSLISLLTCRQNAGQFLRKREPEFKDQVFRNKLAPFYKGLFVCYLTKIF